MNFTSDKLRLKRAMQGLVGQQPRARPGSYNLGVSEAIAIEERRDQIVLAAVVTRECRSNDPRQLAQCERDIISEASQITRNSREDADISLRGLQQLLEQLAYVDGPKSLILISEGLAISETNDLRHLVRLAGAARTAINVLSVDLRRGDVTIAEQPPTEAEDRRILMQGLEAIAAMSRGSLYHIAGTGEPIFERLASEISAYYLLGVEQRPSDSIGDRHRIDVEVRRNDVTIRSRQAFVLSPSTSAKRSSEDSLRDALGSPFAISGLPLRVTTFAQQDPGSEKVRLVVAAQIGEAGAKPGTFTLGYLVIDDQNRIAASFGDQVKLDARLGESQRAAQVHRWSLGRSGHLLTAPGSRGLRGPARKHRARRQRMEDGGRAVCARRSDRRRDSDAGSGRPFGAGGTVRPDRGYRRVSRDVLDNRADVERHDGRPSRWPTIPTPRR